MITDIHLETVESVETVDIHLESVEETQIHELHNSVPTCILV